MIWEDVEGHRISCLFRRISWLFRLARCGEGLNSLTCFLVVIFLLGIDVFLILHGLGEGMIVLLVWRSVDVYLVLPGNLPASLVPHRCRSIRSYLAGRSCKCWAEE